MSSLSDELDKEILARIETIESPDYKYPPRFKKSDYIGMALMGVVCFIGSVAVIIYSYGM